MLLSVFLITSVTGCEIFIQDRFGPKYSTSRGTIAPLASEEGRIMFYRPGSFLWYGDTERPDILLDGHKVGISRPGTVFYVDVEPGKHHVTIPAAVYPRQVSVNVKISKGETVYVMNYVGLSMFAGDMKIEIVDPEQARTDIDDLDWVVHPME